MKNKVLLSMLSLMWLSLLVTGCGKEPEVETTEEVVEVEEPKIEFTGLEGSYHSDNGTIVLEIEEEEITVTVIVDYYEEVYQGEILSNTEAVFYMEMDEEIHCSWAKEDVVWVEPRGDFHEDSIAFGRAVCSALNGNTFKQEEDFVATYTPPKGYYTNSGDGGLAHTYAVTVTSVDNNSFTFTATEEIDGSRNYVGNDFIVDGVAYFNGKSSWYAYYESDDYSLVFDCNDKGNMNITGYEPMEKIDTLYYNLAYIMGW